MKKETLEHIVYALQYEHDKSVKEIAKEYGVDASVVWEINSGKRTTIPGKTYPLRSGRVFSKKEECVPEIKERLKKSPELLQKDIARMYNVSVTFVSNINKGLLYRDSGEKYPLRENTQGNRKRFDFSEIEEIENLLRSGTPSIREIAKRFETSVSMIQNINIGSVNIYRKENCRYPLRETRVLWKRRSSPVSTIRA